MENSDRSLIKHKFENKEVEVTSNEQWRKAFQISMKQIINKYNSNLNFEMNTYEKKPVNYERLVEAVNKDFATYGDMLQYLIIRPYNLPSQYSATIFSVTSLFETLMRYYGNLLASFIGIALLNKGFEYFPLGFIKSHEEVVSYYEYSAISGTSEPSDHLLFSSKGESQLISINIVKQRPYLLDGGEVGFSIEEAFDDLIKAEQEYQEWEKKNGLYIDEEMEEKLNIRRSLSFNTLWIME